MAQTKEEPTTSKLRRGRQNTAQRKKLAQILYLETNLTQQQIAEKAGITPQTMSKWVRDGNWAHLRAAKIVTRPQLVRQYLMQLAELNKLINEREDSPGIPTPAETDKMAKLAKIIDQLDTDTSLPDYIHVVEQFMLFLIRLDKVELLREIDPIFNEFILSRSQGEV